MHKAFLRDFGVRVGIIPPPRPPSPGPGIGSEDQRAELPHSDLRFRELPARDENHRRPTLSHQKRAAAESARGGHVRRSSPAAAAEPDHETSSDASRGRQSFRFAEVSTTSWIPGVAKSVIPPVPARRVKVSGIAWFRIPPSVGASAPGTRVASLTAAGRASGTAATPQSREPQPGMIHADDETRTWELARPGDGAWNAQRWIRRPDATDESTVARAEKPPERFVGLPLKVPTSAVP